MKVVHVSTRDTGGAAIACIRLHLALLESGVDSSLLTLYKERNDIPNHFIYKTLIGERINLLIFRIINKFKKILKLKTKIEFDTDSFSFPKSFYYLHKNELIRKADIIHLHWISGFWDYKSFPKLKGKKVIWTLHDMNPFTGGCHYSNNCQKFNDECSQCPLIKRSRVDIARKNFRYKKRHKVDNICIVTPSIWLKNISLLSNLFNNYQHYHVYHTFCNSITNIIDKNTARLKLELPLDKRIILFVSDSIDTKRKGFGILNDALNKINSDEYLLLIIGKRGNQIDINFPYMHLGYINDFEKLALVYSSSDVYVITSLEDNLPNTVIESISLGTPVIGFNTGGIPEIILQNVNGLICEEASVYALLKSIKYFFNNVKIFDREKIKALAMDQFNNKAIVKKYLKIYSL
jgi:glycosyltransferase involved in cell wall biosynthesis